MNLLDMRTVMFSYVISSLICAVFMASLWKQNRQHSPGLAFWLVDFIMQFMGVLLIVLRGYLPDFFTMVLSNTLIVGGTLLLLIGLERYTSKTRPQGFNYIFIGAFFLFHMYFVYIQDSLQARTINNSLGVLVMCAQCAWLLLRRVDPTSRRGTRPVGMVFVLFSLVSLARIFVDLAAPQGNDFFKSGLYDTLGVLIYQMLYISLTFTLVLMVNRRLFTAVESDITKRKISEAALKVSDEKFSVAFHNSPDAIVISLLSNGKIIDANESFFHITRFSKDESLGRTTIELDLWASLDQRNEFVDTLQKVHRVLNFEAVFRKKSGELFTGSISGELIQLQDQTCVLSVIHDITERKQVELALTEEHTLLVTLMDNIPDTIYYKDAQSRFIRVNQAHAMHLGLNDPAQLIGKTDFDFFGEEHARAAYEDEQAIIRTGQALVDKEEKENFPDGHALWVSTTKMPRRNQQGQIVGTVGISHDITERKKSELHQNAIYRITQAAITSDEIDALYQSIHSILGEMIPAENFFIALYDSTNELISFPYYIDQYDAPPLAPIPIQGLTGYVIRTGRSLLATRETLDQLVQQGEVEVMGTMSVDWLGVPLKVEGRMIGVIAVQTYTEGIHFKQEDMDFLEFVSTQVAQVIERKRLEEEIRSLSLTDELTKLYNRRGFTLLAEQEMKLAHRMKRAMLLFYGDMDKLKAINDTFGHDHGDLALQEVAATLKENFREADILARLGGDEFVVLALDASKESVETMTNRLNAALEARNQKRDKSCRLSLSLGVARFDPEAPCTLSELIAQADSLMYQQKQARKGKR